MSRAAPGAGRRGSPASVPAGRAPEKCRPTGAAPPGPRVGRPRVPSVASPARRATPAAVRAPAAREPGRAASATRGPAEPPGGHFGGRSTVSRAVRRQARRGVRAEGRRRAGRGRRGQRAGRAGPPEPRSRQPAAAGRWPPDARPADDGRRCRCGPAAPRRSRAGCRRLRWAGPRPAGDGALQGRPRSRRLRRPTSARPPPVRHPLVAVPRRRVRRPSPRPLHRPVGRHGREASGYGERAPDPSGPRTRASRRLPSGGEAPRTHVASSG